MPLPECTRRDSDDQAAREVLLADGWREIEVLETWHGQAPKGIGAPVYVAQKPDIPRLQEIARAGFTEDRLHKDPLVPTAEADEAKAKWVSDAVMDYRRVVLIHGDPIDAFVSFFPGETVIVDLIAVHPDQRFNHLATSLLIAACADADARFLQAGTQATNEPAKRLYDSLGMMVIKRERTFHR